MAMIEAEGLSKTFRVAKRRPGLLGGLRSVVDPEVRTVAAVHALSLRVEPGEMLGGWSVPTALARARPSRCSLAS